MREKIYEIWRRNLDLDEFDCDDKFYEIGGNSIIFLMIIEDINDEFGFQLPLEDVYEYETVNKMSAYLEQKLKKE